MSDSQAKKWSVFVVRSTKTERIIIEAQDSAEAESKVEGALAAAGITNALEWFVEGEFVEKPPTPQNPLLAAFNAFGKLLRKQR